MANFAVKTYKEFILADRIQLEVCFIILIFFSDHAVGLSLYRIFEIPGQDSMNYFALTSN